jgi:hypothetical protein
MDRPNRNAKTISGTHMVMAPVAGTPKMARDPWPSWNTQVSTP